jgi:predicted ester cyclase
MVSLEGWQYGYESGSQIGAIMPENDVQHVVRDYLISYQDGPANLLDCLHDQHQYHGPAGAAPVDLSGRRQESEAFCLAFSQIEVTIQDLITEGDTAAARILMQATHTGVFHGISPTGRRIEMRYTEFLRVREGKILEEWAEFDLGSMIAQLQ